MQLHYLAYHSLIILSIILSFVAIMDGHKRYLPLLIVLISTELVEMFAQVAIFNKANFDWVYHLFVALEYALFAIYLRLAIHIRRVKKIILVSIPLFIVYSLLISYFFYDFKGFPGINISTEGFLLFIFCLVLLFNIDVVEHQSIFANPDIWIAFGILLFEGGTFFYNGVYSKLLSLDKLKAIELFGLINKPLNICFYTFINIGLICLIRKRKFIMP